MSGLAITFTVLYCVGIVVVVFYHGFGIADSSHWDEDGKKHHTRMLFLSPLWPITYAKIAIEKFLWAFGLPTPTLMKKKDEHSHD